MQKTLNNFLFYTTVILTGIFVLAILPNFTINLNNGYLLKWQGLSSLGISENLFNFSLGEGLYSKNQVEFVAKQGANEREAFLQAFNRDKFTITKKLAMVNSVVGADISIREYLPSPDKRTITFTFPENILQPDQLASELMTRESAVMTISTSDPSKESVDNAALTSIFPGFKAIPAGLNLSDVINYGIDTSTLVRYPVMRTDFKPELMSTLEQIFDQTTYDTNTGAPKLPLVLMVNGYPEFWAFHPDLFGNARARGTFPTSIIWIPLAQTDKIGLTIKAAGIFGEQIDLDYDSTPHTTIAPDYAPEGKKFIAISILILLAIFILRAFQLYKLEGAIYFGLGFGATIATTVALAKLAALSLEPVLLATMVIFLTAIGAWGLSLFAKPENLQRQLHHAIYLSLIMFLLTATLFQLPATKLLRGFEMLFIIGVVWLAAAGIYFRSVVNMYYKSQS